MVLPRIVWLKVFRKKTYAQRYSLSQHEENQRNRRAFEKTRDLFTLGNKPIHNNSANLAVHKCGIKKLRGKTAARIILALMLQRCQP